MGFDCRKTKMQQHPSRSHTYAHTYAFYAMFNKSSISFSHAASVTGDIVYDLFIKH